MQNPKALTQLDDYKRPLSENLHGWQEEARQLEFPQ